jgi:hypothetical protein
MRKSWIVGGALVAAVVAWALFRPERLFVDRSVSEAFPESTPIAAMTPDSMSGAILSTGRFHSNAHETKGVATIHRLSDGRRVLRLTAFETSNGPDVRIYLVAAGDARDEAGVKAAGFIDLGGMKGNSGDQNYDVPATVDLSKYRAVSIWCRRFSVNFGAAPLAEPTSGS